MSHKLKVRIGDRWYTVVVEDLEASPVKALVDGDLVEVWLDRPQADGHADLGSEPSSAPVARSPEVTRRPASAVKVFSSPMPGIIVSVAVKEADHVVTGDEVCVLEAMKMQQTLRADWSGVVSAVHVRPGQQVLDGDPIVDLE